MAVKCTLPFEKSDIQSFAYFAFADGIFLANMGKSYKNLMTTRFINFCYNPQKDIYTLISDDDWEVNSGILIHQKMELNKAVFAEGTIDLVRIFKKAILSSLYVYGIRGVNQDKYLITGYDEKTNTFEVWQLDCNIGLVFEWIPADELYPSLFETPDKDLRITFWKYNTASDCLLDFQKLKTGIHDYLNSTSKDQQNVYGLNAIQELADYFKKQSEGAQPIDKRFLDSFVEHKYFMNQRIEYLASKRIIPVSLTQKSKEIAEMANAVKDSGMIYNSGKCNQEILKLTSLIIDSIRIEKEYLPSVREAIKEMN